jgi:hypothetical protein
VPGFVFMAVITVGLVWINVRVGTRPVAGVRRRFVAQ